MSENDKDNKDNKDFEFIKEQVIEKKRRKIKKRLLPLLMTICLAILFGLIAAVTFVITEPKLYKLLHKEEETITPVSFPTQHPDGTDSEEANSQVTPTAVPKYVETPVKATPDPVIQKIDAGIKDFTNMYSEIHKIAYEMNKSQLYITSTFTVFDIFGNEVEKTIDTSGIIVANNNTDFLVLVSLDGVQDAKSIKVKFDTTYIDAEVQDYESELNLALLAVAIKDIPKISLNELQIADLGESYSIAVGNPVIALGNPNGHFGSMDVGIISSKGSWADVTDNRIDLFNTNMDSNAYSDGVIVDMNGLVIGWITRTLREDVNEELNTAIGISELKPVIEQMANQNPRIYFGIKTDDLTEDAKQEHELQNGIFVSEVLSESPAFDAGLKNGDIILSVSDQIVLSTNNFYSTISGFKDGQEVAVKIKRSAGSVEKEITLSVVMAEKVQK